MIFHQGESHSHTESRTDSCFTYPEAGDSRFIRTIGNDPVYSTSFFFQKTVYCMWGTVIPCLWTREERDIWIWIAACTCTLSQSESILNLIIHSYCHDLWVCVAIDGVWIGWLDLLTHSYTPLATINNYGATADLHTLQFTVTHTLGFSVFTSRILATDFNSVTVTDVSSFHSRTLATQRTRCHLLSVTWAWVLSLILRSTVSPSWKKAPIWGLRPDYYSCQTVAGLLVWGAFSHERTDLSSTVAAGSRQRSHFRVQVP
jgi:hypothetical protein